MKTTRHTLAAWLAAGLAALATPVAALAYCNPAISSSMCLPESWPPEDPIPAPLVRTLDLTNQRLQSLSIFGVRTGAHLAGNMEVRILPSAALQGISCDGVFITTRQARDPGRDMFAVLRGAFEKGRTVNLRVTNDPNLKAYPGRCSLVAVQEN